MVWVAVPTLLFAMPRISDRPIAPLVSLCGGILLALALMWVPFLQAHYAATGRITTFIYVALVREWFRRAPFAMLMALLLILTVPLYVLKIVVPPRDAVWLLTPLFVLLILPGRLVVGWAVSRAMARPDQASLATRVIVSLGCWAALTAYLAILFLTARVAALGARILFDHHAVLLPTPFL